MNILVLYYSRTYPLRTTVVDHLYSFERYSGARCFYVNLGLPWIPSALKSVKFDLVVFHTILLWERVLPMQFNAHVNRASWVADLPCPKVILPQDEYLHGDVLADFISRFGITHVMSAAQPDQWPLLYPEVDRDRVKFETVLTGYLADSTLERIEGIVARSSERPLDIGYRAFDPWPSWGRHGLAKVEVGRVVQARAAAHGLLVDISNNPQDTFIGDAWYEFLASCRAVLGVEGGASILDYDGSIMECTLALAETNPDATFDDYEAACFPGRDGEINYVAISPRHLECCATKTCQLLVEGHYNGVLIPGLHYFEIRRDLSNVDDVLELLKDEQRRLEVVEAAYRDVVESGRWTYRGFVELVLERTVGTSDVVCAAPTGAEAHALRLVRVRDRILWRAWGFAWQARGWLERIVGRERVALWVKSVKRGLGETQ